MAWEAGTVRPTVRQARLLANDYDRPFLEFFSTEIPDIKRPQLIPDFRLHRNAAAPGENRSLLEIQSWAETQRLNALDLFEIIGERPPEFPDDLYATIESSPAEIAAKMRLASKFPISAQRGLNNVERDKLPKKLRAVFEAMGVLILKDSALRNFEARGLCIFFEFLPVIIFGNESPGAQAFTITHEIGHIILKKSAIIGDLPDRNQRSDVARIERWCNRFAAAFLVPSDELSRDLKKPTTPADKIEDAELNRITSYYGISRHMMLIRLVELGYVKADFYWSFKRPALLQEEANFESFGRPTYYGSRYRSSVGDLYTGLVLEAWSTGRITNHNASEFMGIKNISHLNEIRDHFGK